MKWFNTFHSFRHTCQKGNVHLITFFGLLASSLVMNTNREIPASRVWWWEPLPVSIEEARTREAPTAATSVREYDCFATVGASTTAWPLTASSSGVKRHTPRRELVSTSVLLGCHIVSYYFEFFWALLNQQLNFFATHTLCLLLALVPWWLGS